ncbi:hypothetical protein [Rhodovarius sp.]|uniref:hypothetical protein n=1 Tax=Rhodovarius sp. TaxID=2972673 RepID=UPI0034A33778
MTPPEAVERAISLALAPDFLLTTTMTALNAMLAVMAAMLAFLAETIMAERGAR